MPVNEFEKQVQQKMNELQLHPSGEVWEEVQARIRREKRRRRGIIFWWLLAALLVGSGSTWYFATQRNQVANADNKSASAQPANHETAIQQKENEQTNTSSTNNNFNFPQTGSDDPATITPKSSTNAKDVISYKVTGAAMKKTGKKQNDSHTKPVATKTDIAVNVPVIANKDTETQPVVQPVIREPAQNNLSVTDSVMVAKKDTAVPEPLTTITENNTAESKKENKKNWTFGLNIGPGISTTKAGLFFGQKELFSTAQSGPGGYPAPPSSPSAAASFSLEVFAQKKLSNRLFLQTGISYANLGSRISAGRRVDSSGRVNNGISSGAAFDYYYNPNITASDGSSNYNNRFSLLGLSVHLSWKLSDKARSNIYWENGFILYRLLSSHALLYDPALRGYYSDPGAYRRTPLFFSTALVVPLMQRNRFSLSARPFISYSLSKVLKESDSQHDHYLNYGLGLRFLFNNQ